MESPVYTADAVSFLLEDDDVEHLRRGTWIHFRIPFAGDTTHQGYVSNIEEVRGPYTRVTVIPFGEQQKRLDESLHPGLNTR